MENFDEYLIQGEPNKAEKAKNWKTAIGLQQVDGLIPSEYLIETARQNIEGAITIEEVKKRIDHYYQQQSTTKDENRTEEADKVSARVAELLSEQTFAFSPAEYLTIHRRLFKGIYKFAGKIRNYNITKIEWVLQGETVLYASADSLKATLEYDFDQERKFSFNGLSEQEIIEHMAGFISGLWQIHIFGNYFCSQNSFSFRQGHCVQRKMNPNVKQPIVSSFEPQTILKNIFFIKILN
jgi:hypothetical protein